MSKVICDICGTVYQETADKCPICGYSRMLGIEEPDEDVSMDETILTRNKGGRFAQSVVKKKNKEIFDFDQVNPEENEDEEEEEYDEEEDYAEQPRSNSAIIVILVVVIMLLLAVTGFLFLRFFLPNMLFGEKDIPETVATVPTVTESEPTTEPTIPCDSIALTGGIAELNKEGQFWLLNVKVMPEDTTDTLTYTSEDESIATVTVDGRVTAVSEGETTIYITCGKKQINCPVIVKFVEETVPPTEETTDETASTEETVEETVETADTTLKLKKYDITLSVGYGDYLILDCDLDPSEVKWSVEHDYIATVDENGFVRAISYGTTGVIVEYGDQKVQCIIRCK